MTSSSFGSGATLHSSAAARSWGSRRIDVAALMPDGQIVEDSRPAPALPVFEEAATALARGTLIPGLRGLTAIEDLQPGDLVRTAAGDALPVVWIGSTLYHPDSVPEGSALGSLTRILPLPGGDDGGRGLDLLTGPGARMVVRHPRLRQLLGQPEVLAPVNEYRDGDRILPVRPAGPVQLFHLMLLRHAILDLGPAQIESYHPGKGLGQLGQYGLRGAFMALFPQIDHPEGFGQLQLTRTNRSVIENLIDS